MNFDKVVSLKYGSKEIEYGIVKGNGDVVLLIKVGQGGSIYGYENKYLKIAKHINDKYGIGVVVSSNPYDKTDSLEQAIRLIKEEFGEVDIYYMGNSNGAILGARFGYLHPEIKRMLLINGPLMINWSQTKQGVQMFKGERVVFVYGSKDVSFGYVELIKNLLVEEKIRLEIIEGADHNFVGMDREFLELAEKYLFGRMINDFKWKNEVQWNTFFDNLSDTGVIVINGRQGMGKTGFVFNEIVKEAKDKEKSVLYFSLEYSFEQLRKIVGYDVFKSEYLFVYDTVPVSIKQFLEECKKYKEKEDVKYVIVDYVQLLNNEIELKYLRLIANALKITVFLVSQCVYVFPNERKDKIALLNNVRTSGIDIENVDAIVHLHRESFYDHKSGDDGNIILFLK